MPVYPVHMIAIVVPVRGIVVVVVVIVVVIVNDLTTEFGIFETERCRDPRLDHDSRARDPALGIAGT